MPSRLLGPRPGRAADISDQGSNGVRPEVPRPPVEGSLARLEITILQPCHGPPLRDARIGQAAQEVRAHDGVVMVSENILELPETLQRGTKGSVGVAEDFDGVAKLLGRDTELMQGLIGHSMGIDGAVGGLQVVQPLSQELSGASPDRCHE
jgi:hypothetical protein